MSVLTIRRQSANVIHMHRHTLKQRCKRKVKAAIASGKFTRGRQQAQALATSVSGTRNQRRLRKGSSWTSNMIYSDDHLTETHA